MTDEQRLANVEAFAIRAQECVLALINDARPESDPVARASKVSMLVRLAFQHALEALEEQMDEKRALNGLVQSINQEIQRRILVQRERLN